MSTDPCPRVYSLGSPLPVSLSLARGQTLLFCPQLSTGLHSSIVSLGMGLTVQHRHLPPILGQECLTLVALAPPGSFLAEHIVSCDTLVDSSSIISVGLSTEDYLSHVFLCRLLWQLALRTVLC